jgi:thymidine kinase
MQRVESSNLIVTSNKDDNTSESSKNIKNLENSENSENTGYLELIIGPMFSGKTSEIIEIYKKCKFCNISVSIINHTTDTRYHETMISSHDKIMVPCLQATNLSDIWFGDSQQNELHNSDVILINEGQFFPDLYDIVVDMLEHGKKVYICGLDGDFERKKFGSILDLIPLCDNVKKLKSLCSICRNGTLGIFSMRLTNEKEQTIVGSDNYIPVCRNCYKNNIKKS